MKTCHSIVRRHTAVPVQALKLDLKFSVHHKQFKILDNWRKGMDHSPGPSCYPQTKAQLGKSENAAKSTSPPVVEKSHPDI